MEFEKAGLSDHVLVRSAADSKDTEIPNIESEYRMGYDLTVELLREGQPVTAIAALNDMMAFGAMDALLERQYRIPGDISVVGCDNTLFSRFHTIGLTTVDISWIRKGGMPVISSFERSNRRRVTARETNLPVFTISSMNRV